MSTNLDNLVTVASWTNCRLAVSNLLKNQFHQPTAVKDQLEGSKLDLDELANSILGTDLGNCILKTIDAAETVKKA
jgi:hypothetical protein